MPALVLTADLATLARISAAGQRSGCPVESAMTEAALVENLARSHAGLVVVDLSMPGLDAAGLLPRLAALADPPQTIIAFGPHVHHDKLAAAAQAGATRVLSRGQFFAQADALLALHARPGPAQPGGG